MSDLSARVADAFHTLPPAISAPSPGFDATYHVRLGDIGAAGRSAVRRSGRACGPGGRAAGPTSVIGTDAETWLQLRAGRAVRRRGVLASAACTRRGDPRPRGRLRGPVPASQRAPAAAEIHHVPSGKLRISTLTMGEGPDMLLLHGLGATKSSVLRHRGRAQPHATASTRSTCRASAARPSRRWRPTARRVRPGRLRRRWTRSASPAPTRRQLDGRPGGDRGRLERPERVGGHRAAQPRRGVRQARLALARALRPPRARHAAALARPRRIERTFWTLFADRDLVDPSWPTSSSTSSSASTARAARGWRSSPAPARSTSTPVGARLLPAAGRRCSRPRCSSGPRTTS
jgi:hypothetical protein